MSKILRKILISNAIQNHKRYKVLCIFIILVYIDGVFFDVYDYEWSSLIVSPIKKIEIFLSLILFSLTISWKIYDLKNERDYLKYLSSIIASGVYISQSQKDEMRDQLEDEIDEYSFQIDENASVASILFFINLATTGYLALCVSNAIISKKCSWEILCIL